MRLSPDKPDGGLLYLSEHMCAIRRWMRLAYGYSRRNSVRVTHFVFRSPVFYRTRVEETED
jgi:hypothetical protein